ncbi:MAG TPA: sulfotransferase [Xanthomonadaceae bacterium]|jgi:hypothetical protein
MTARPNFLFIGADKCGSSWLHKVLSEHPQCFIPPAKDIYFFDRFYEKGLDWYLRFFADAPGQARCVGEVCHDYLYSAQAAQRIARDLPDVKLVAFLREPADRTFSHYLYMIRSGRTRVSFREALESYPELVEHSSYAKHLAPYFELFPEGQLKVFFYDDLRAAPREFARSIFEFLGLEWTDSLDYEGKVRPASAPRSFLLAKALKQGAALARNLGWANFVGRIKNSSFAFRLYKPYKAAAKPAATDEERKYLLAALDADLHQLVRVLPQPLPAWIPAGDDAARVQARPDLRSEVAGN